MDSEIAQIFTFFSYIAGSGFILVALLKKVPQLLSVANYDGGYMPSQWTSMMHLFFERMTLSVVGIRLTLTDMVIHHGFISHNRNALNVLSALCTY